MDPQPPTPPMPIPPVISSLEPKSKVWLWVTGGILLLVAGFVVGIFLGKQLYSQNTAQIDSYDQCVAATGSIVQESYPATCITTSGQRFIQPLTDEEKQNLQPPDQTSELTDTATATWKTYTNDKLKIELKYPPTDNGSPLEVFTTETNPLVFALRISQTSRLYFDIALLSNSETLDWYKKAYGEAKQEQVIPPPLSDGPVVGGLPSKQSTFNVMDPTGSVTHIFVQKGKNLYQIV